MGWNSKCNARSNTIWKMRVKLIGDQNENRKRIIKIMLNE